MFTYKEGEAQREVASMYMTCNCWLQALDVCQAVFLIQNDVCLEGKYWHGVEGNAWNSRFSNFFLKNHVEVSK